MSFGLAGPYLDSSEHSGTAKKRISRSNEEKDGDSTVLKQLDDERPIQGPSG
jgi:hypothetical protein